ncbi:D-alanyl-D-alanine carboxypeptidase/D-alanyl-D-alanine-endopeptidase (penicillin-binding protein 4) [Virgibacillus natechei]|uniref:D-alanyl-D-alanine carboxypeptidase/D-alanyl-D-alanine-endopeptidase (Penicillin-binding protein 4) n=1 Tax=Virgibacillus natechei TaxID=1216297 RepID=A0ABS4IK35_9BACI|nr:D-alanyl-D-alanine carboxypeptidase/D-alanyl-D-alanine-endopeptidase (penicillin-binding protein 4) [Virgibacillus natechei]
MRRNMKKWLLFFLIAVVALLLFIDQEDDLFIVATDEQEEVEEVFREDATLHEKIDTILDDEKLDGAVTGVSIRDANTGDVLYSADGDIRLRPASNMKLLTGVAALETLGADYQFSTDVLTDGEQKGDVLAGNLYVRGKGDPTLLKTDLDQFAKDLKDQGIHEIDGNVIADDSWYDDIRLSQDLNWSDQPFHTGAQVSALTLSPDEDYDAGTVIVEVVPTAQMGEQAEVSITPKTDYVTIVNNTEMVAETQEKDITIEREHGSNNIIVEGEIPLNGVETKAWSSVWEPTGYVLDVFKNRLEENSIDITADSEFKMARTPEDATLLTAKNSMTLEELLIPFMKLSNNGHGETLTKEMGKVVHDEGSWDKGLDVIEEAVAELGMDDNTIMVRDGSGMSHKNLIPANELSQLLYTIQDKSWFPKFKDSLPVAGESERLVGGTLRYRMTEDPTKGKVAAKTGDLNGVSALSGYVTAADGEELIFSIMINNYIGPSVKEIEDAIATVLIGHEFDE